MTEYEEYERQERIKEYNDAQRQDKEYKQRPKRKYQVLPDPESKEFKRAVGKRVSKHKRRGFVSPENNFTYEDIANLYEKQEGCCYACFAPFNEVAFEIDHKVALSLLGHNGAENIQLLCKSCNISKKDQDFHKWISTVRTRQVKEYLMELDDEPYYA